MALFSRFSRSLRPYDLLSWRLAVAIIALLNLKVLPFSWHLRLLYRFLRNFYSWDRVQRTLIEATENDSIHPIFQSVAISCSAPLGEIDYNFHKSNATYFTDLDESRTALVTKLYGAASKHGQQNLEAEGYKGRLSVVLGSVHTNFFKEIKPYEGYEVRSRVVGWDKKWLVIGSFFVKPAKSEKEEVLFASALSKYVVKKGRFTVSPERCLVSAGWLPKRPEIGQAGPREVVEKLESSKATVVHAEKGGESEGDVQPASSEEVVAPAPEAAVHAAAVVEKLERVASNVSSKEESALKPLTTAAPRANWDWHRIDMERLRGLQIFKGWLDLDKSLKDEATYHYRRQSMDRI